MTVWSEEVELEREMFIENNFLKLLIL
jgi:hypothetical protein